jgi:BlaI family penicillinase repressor
MHKKVHIGREETMGGIGGRSREVLDTLYRLGEATAADVHREIPDFPSYSAVRSALRALETKGFIEHARDGARYVYRPTRPAGDASRGALARVLDTFFGGSPEHALKALMDLSRERDYAFDYDDVQSLIDRAREEGR